VRLLRRWSAIVGFDFPMPRLPHVPSARPAPDASQVELVAFHADLAEAPSGIHERVDYRRVLELSFESAERRAPRARRVLLTDERTRWADGLRVHEVRRLAVDPTRLMYERMRAQQAYLASRPAGSCVAFMDSDVVVNRDPAPIFAADFDVGLTWRRGFPDAPFNGGMLFVRAGDAGERFFAHARSCYDALADSSDVASLFPRDLRSWWGDQFAIAILAGFRECGERVTDGLQVDGIKLRFLPCTEYNFTLEAGVAYEPTDLARRYFLHFKGNRKSLQAQYLAAMRSGRI
jgi:hypothetical protein